MSPSAIAPPWAFPARADLSHYCADRHTHYTGGQGGNSIAGGVAMFFHFSSARAVLAVAGAGVLVLLSAQGVRAPALPGSSTGTPFGDVHFDEPGNMGRT